MSSNELASAIDAALDPKAKSKASLRGVIADLVIDETNGLTPLSREAATLVAAAAGEAAPAKRAAVLDALSALAAAFQPRAIVAHGVDDRLLDMPVADGVRLRDLRKPILDRLPVLVPLLRDSNAATRIAAAQLFAMLPEARAASALEDAVKNESDPLVRYNLLFALAMHGGHADVPAPPAKNSALAVIAQVVRTMHGGKTDAKVLDEARKLPSAIEGFPVVSEPNSAVVAALVGAHFRAKDPAGPLALAASLKTRGTEELIAESSLDAIWPLEKTPIEPRASLAKEERAWLKPLFEHLAEERQWPAADVFVRHGIIPTGRGVHVRRLLGIQSGPADEKRGDAPLWLLARRVVDGRQPATTWTDAMKGRELSSVIDLLRDLLLFAVADPWPTIRLPYTTTAELEAYARYFALVRATFDLFEVKELEAFVDDEGTSPHQPAAFASMLHRGFKLAKKHDARIGELLNPGLAYDVEGLREALRAIPEDRRETVLADLEPDFELDAVHEKPRPSGLWYFADVAPKKALGKLIQHLANTIATDPCVSKPKTKKDEAIGEALRHAIESAFRGIGPLATAPVREALGKAKQAARPLLELALAATGEAVPNATKPKKK